MDSQYGQTVQYSTVQYRTGQDRTGQYRQYGQIERQDGRMKMQIKVGTAKASDSTCRETTVVYSGPQAHLNVPSLDSESDPTLSSSAQRETQSETLEGFCLNMFKNFRA